MMADATGKGGTVRNSVQGPWSNIRWARQPGNVLRTELGLVDLLQRCRDRLAIVVGFAIAAVLFIDRMAGAITIEGRAPLVPEDRADDANGTPSPPAPHCRAASIR